MAVYKTLPSRRVALNPPAPKRDEEKFLTAEQFEALLKAVEEHGGVMRFRDHALFFLAYYLGLRVGEVVLLRREHLHLDEGEGTISIPTLKCQPKVACKCSECGRKVFLRLDRAGTQHRCSCGAASTVPAADKHAKPYTERTPAIIERHVLDYLRQLESNLPPGQAWLFPSEARDGEHLSRRRAGWLFKYYARLASLPARMSFHALRHGRGAAVWSISQDRELVRKQLRHTSLNAGEFYVHLSPERLKEYQDRLERLTPQRIST